MGDLVASRVQGGLRSATTTANKDGLRPGLASRPKASPSRKQTFPMATQHLSAPSSGAIHVRVRHRENFTILANRLAQRSGSAVTVGVAAYLLSVADGTPITIEALQAHFTEGETLLSRALNELEAEGWLERRLERTPQGRLTTRTFVYDAPSAPSATGSAPDPRPREPEPAPEPAEPTRSTAAATRTVSPEARGVLSALRTHDPRLALSARDLARLAPAVDAWFQRGAWPSHITQALTTNLPDHLTAGPAALLAHRLRELLPSPTAPADRPSPVPLQTCDACDRAFRSPTPGRCRDCRGCRPRDSRGSQLGGGGSSEPEAEVVDRERGVTAATN